MIKKWSFIFNDRRTSSDSSNGNGTNTRNDHQQQPTTTAAAAVSAEKKNSSSRIKNNNVVVSVWYINGDKDITVNISKKTTVVKLKKKIKRHLGIDSKHQIVLHEGIVLNDNDGLLPLAIFQKYDDDERAHGDEEQTQKQTNDDMFRLCLINSENKIGVPPLWRRRHDDDPMSRNNDNNNGDDGIQQRRRRR